jgi:hypothetical protein
MLRAEPQETLSTTLRKDPKAAKPNTENDDPRRESVLIDMQEPKLILSRTLKLDAINVIPKTDNADPQREKLRTLKPEESCT